MKIKLVIKLVIFDKTFYVSLASYITNNHYENSQNEDSQNEDSQNY